MQFQFNYNFMYVKVTDKYVPPQVCLTFLRWILTKLRFIPSLISFSLQIFFSLAWLDYLFLDLFNLHFSLKYCWGVFIRSRLAVRACSINKFSVSQMATSSTPEPLSASTPSTTSSIQTTPVMSGLSGAIPKKLSSFNLSKWGSSFGLNTSTISNF